MLVLACPSSCLLCFSMSMGTVALAWLLAVVILTSLSLWFESHSTSLSMSFGGRRRRGVGGVGDALLADARQHGLDWC